MGGPVLLVLDLHGHDGAGEGASLSVLGSLRGQQVRWQRGVECVREEDKLELDLCTVKITPVSPLEVEPGLGIASFPQLERKLHFANALACLCTGLGQRRLPFSHPASQGAQVRGVSPPWQRGRAAQLGVLLGWKSALEVQTACCGVWRGKGVAWCGMAC